MEVYPTGKYSVKSFEKIVLREREKKSNFGEVRLNYYTLAP